MERKTKIHAEDGKQELVITREFDLPLELLFKAYEEPELIEQWMGTKVLKLENKKITRTFEFENTPFGVQLEVMEFEQLTEDTSKLTMHTVFESVAQRDQML